MRILVVKMSSMGDVIHTLPALSDASTAIPNIEFHWVVEESFSEIPAWHSNVTKVIPVSWRRWRKNIRQALNNHEPQKFWHQLRDEKYDLIIDAQGLFKSAAVSMIAHGKRYGLNFKSAREPFASLSYNHRYAVAKNQHAVTRIRQLFAQALGYAVPQAMPNYGISKLNNTQQINAEKYLIFIHGTSRNEKLWPEKYWIELAKLAAENNYKIKLPWGSEAEHMRANHIAQHCPNAEVLPRLKLSEIATILANSCGAVAVDTGLGHLAAALEVPCISLYGKTDPNLIGAFGKNQIHLTAQTTNTTFVDIPTITVWRKLNDPANFTR